MKEGEKNLDEKFWTWKSLCLTFTKEEEAKKTTKKYEKKLVTSDESVTIPEAPLPMHVFQ